MYSLVHKNWERRFDHCSLLSCSSPFCFSIPIGETIQELCGIQMNVITRQIVDVHHAHAVRHSHDNWAYDHIHGLALHFFRQHGLSCEAALIYKFKQWLRWTQTLPSMMWSVFTDKLRESWNYSKTVRINPPRHEIEGGSILLVSTFWITVSS